MAAIVTSEISMVEPTKENAFAIFDDISLNYLVKSFNYFQGAITKDALEYDGEDPHIVRATLDRVNTGSELDTITGLNLTHMTASRDLPSGRSRAEG